MSKATLPAHLEEIVETLGPDAIAAIREFIPNAEFALKSMERKGNCSLTITIHGQKSTVRDEESGDGAEIEECQFKVVARQRIPRPPTVHKVELKRGQLSLLPLA